VRALRGGAAGGRLATGLDGRWAMRPAARIPAAAAAILGAAALAATSAGPPPQAGRNTPWDAYSLLLTRNIFSRNRTVYTPRAWRPTSRPVDTRPAPAMVLTGTAVQERGRIAFFEDPMTGETLWAVPGQAVGGGTLVAVSESSVEYRSWGARRTLLLGDSITGAPGTLAPAAGAGAMPFVATRPAGTTGPSPARSAPAGGTDILERMRRRRMQEMGR